jgi:broad specificity phosphatase PhoE
MLKIKIYLIIWVPPDTLKIACNIRKSKLHGTRQRDVIMTVDWLDLFGYACVALIIVSLAMTRMLSLRIVFMLSSVLALIYSLLIPNYPLLILSLTLIVLNGYKIFKIWSITSTKITPSIAAASFDQLLPYMKKRILHKGDLLFEKGDPVDKTYFIKEGVLEIKELNMKTSAGDVLGEIGLFSPEHKRTATVVATTDSIVYEISENHLKQFFYQDPAFGFSLLRMITTRLIQNERRLAFQYEYQGKALKKSSTTIYLIRHGETDWNLEKRLQGQTDVSLNKTGKAQAMACAETIKDISFQRCFTSDLLRAYETALILKGEREFPVSMDKRLRERNVGQFEGALKEHYYQIPDLNGKIESDEQLKERMMIFLHEVRASYPGETILIVAHAEVIKSIFLELNHLKRPFSLVEIQNLAFLKISCDNGEWKIDECQGIELSNKPT